MDIHNWRREGEENEEEHLKKHNNIPDKDCETCRHIVFHSLSHDISEAFEDMDVGEALDFLASVVTSTLMYVPVEQQDAAFGEFVRNLSENLAEEENENGNENGENLDPDEEIKN